MFKNNEQRAKSLSLKVWDYFRKHPKIKKEADLPFSLQQKVFRDIYCCPLCTLYYDIDCKGCPLGDCEKGSLYLQWRFASNIESRQQAAATEIYNKIKEWKI